MNGDHKIEIPPHVKAAFDWWNNQQANLSEEKSGEIVFNASEDDVQDAFDTLEDWEWSAHQAPIPDDPSSLEDMLNNVARYGAALLLAEFRKTAKITMNPSDGDPDDDPSEISIGLYVSDMPYFDIWIQPYDLIKSNLEPNDKKAQKNQLSCLRRLIDRIETEIDESK